MNKALTKSEVNHLRRLLGYVRCNIGQSPDELVATVRGIAGKIDGIDEQGKQRLVESHAKSSSVPAYVRDAVKSLEKAIKEQYGEVVDAEKAQVKIEETK
jgi:hypothetical protein